MSTASSRLSINLQALAANYALLKSKVRETCLTAGVVKADAYGLGMAEILPALERQDCPFYFVATLDEAIALRKLTAKPIAALGGLYSGAEKEYLAHQIIPVMNSADEIERKAYEGPSIWHFETGMNRLGIRPEDVPMLIENGYSAPFMVMQHFACADEHHALNETQAANFMRLAQHFPDAKRSICNSAAIFRNPHWHADMVRPGMALYGLNPTPDQPNPMRRVVTLETRLLQVKPGSARETVGYGATHVLPRDTVIGIVAIGYADGFLRSGSSKAFIYWNGYPCPVLGRVSMDLIAIDLGELPPTSPRPVPGDWLEVIGEHQSPDDLATACGTIGYEILTSLGDRAHRSYLAA